MRLRIHHGATQVGGNCVELECQGKRLLLDLGLPLDSEPRLPRVSGILKADPDLLGVVLSHPHLDHYGLLPLAEPGLPVWMGAAAIRMLKIAAPFTAAGEIPQVMTKYHSGQAFSAGPFRITPYLMDHSAYDAHALLVEAAGKRLFYSGDFRGHGRKSGVFEQLLATPPRNIDLLLMEGTTLGRGELPFSEAEVEAQALAIMQDTSGPVLACFSAQNIDRFVSFFRASVRAGRTFVLDAYLANLISGLELGSLPDPASDARIRVFLPASQKRMIMRSSRFDLIDRYRSRRIFADEIAGSTGAFTLMFRSSMARDFPAPGLDGAALIYSMWPGYLERDRIDLRQWAHNRGIGFQIMHSSGHAHRTDLQRLVTALRPGRLMPIHTVVPNQYRELHSNVEQVGNLEWADV
jgi:ribonuclease J